MTWQSIPITELAELSLGKMLDEKKNRGEFRPYLANVNVRWGSFDLDDLRTMPFEPFEADRCGLRFGDIVMCEGGEPGRCAIWKDQIADMMYQKALHRIRAKEGVDSRFLYYSFLRMGRSGVFAQFFTGSTIKHLPKEKLKLVKLRIPDIVTQQAVADKLEMYDDLLENNRRRIKLLEEAARLIYREWFVHLRFPGYEHTKIKNGIPEGWGLLSFSSIAEFLNGFAFKPTELLDHGLPVIKIPELKDGVTTKTPFNPGDQIPARFIVEDGDLLFSWSGTLAVNYWVGRPGLLNQHLFKVTPITGVSRGFLYCAVQAALVEFGNATTGATMKHIRRSALDTTKTLVGSDELMAEFAGQIEPLTEQVRTLRKVNIGLAKARDLLLPRLMSGEIEV